MEIILEIFREKNLPSEGKTLKREAGRGVTFAKNNKLLMVYSTKRGDFKFPGGGVQKGETHEDALKREVAEECGLKIDLIKELGKVIEYKKARERSYDIFQMNSYYYICSVSGSLDKTDLDEYEKKLGFTPVWVELEEALDTNRKILNSKPASPNSWVERETKVLEWLKEKKL